MGWQGPTWVGWGQVLKGLKCHAKGSDYLLRTDMSKCAAFQETHSGSHMGMIEALVTENNTARFKG